MGRRRIARYFLFVGLLMIAGAAAVAAQSVSTNFDKNANFSQYKTYQWVPIKEEQRLDDLTADQLVGTFEVELAKKGLTKSKKEEADLDIGYQTVRLNDKHPNHYEIGSPYSAAAGAASGNAAATTVHTGQLVLLMYDAAKKQLVWSGTVSSAIDPDAKPDKKQKNMDKAVEKLLKGYPPQNK